MKNTFLFIILFSFFFASKSWGQNSNRTECLGNLSSANNYYKNARFSDAIGILEPCIQSGKLRNKAAEAYRLLGLCYMQLNDEKKASNAIAKLLKANHLYQLFPNNDPKRFTQLVNTFKVETKMRIGVKTGFNFSMPAISKAFSIKPADLEVVSNSGQYLGITGDYMFKYNTFGITAWLTSGSLTFSENATFNDAEKIHFKEELKHVDLGIEFKYYPIKTGKIKPYIGFGVNALFIHNAISNVVYTNSYLDLKSESSRDMKAEGSINPLIYNGIADIGFNIKAGKGLFGLGLQYGAALSLCNNPNKRYENISYLLANQWIDSDVKINYINVYATYSFPILWRIFK